MMDGARGALDTHITTWNPSCHLFSVEPRSHSCAWGASTSTHDVPSLYVWTSWRRCCSCCCVDRLWWLVIATVMTTRRQLRMTTSSTPTHDYIGSLLQLFFLFSARLVVTIHDILLTSILGWHDKSSASVAYSFSYDCIRAVLCSSWSRSCTMVICDGSSWTERLVRTPSLLCV
jgi:hypothetical protein